MSKTPQLIKPDEVYTVPEFRRRMAVGDYTMRQMRKRGLRVIEISPRNRVVRGADFLDWLEKVADTNGGS